jgi:hypothetical protein
MKRFFALLLSVFLCLSAVGMAQCVLGVEANGPDEATKSAYTWRHANVYPYYASKGFTVVEISQSSAAKVETALSQNAVTHITGCGHGSPTVYTGYGQATVFSTSNTALLQKLAGKYIHVLSCLTAQQLGPAMISNGAAGYAGYYPSFYFTWKSTARFFDADAEMDRAFAEGQTPKQAYQRTINYFNNIMEILQKEEPDAVRYLVIDRDGLRCFPAREEDSEETESVMPLEMASHILFAQNPATRGYLTFAEVQNSPTLAASFSTMSAADFKALTIAAYEKCPRDFEVGILSYGRIHRDQIIDEITQGTALGNSFVQLEKTFLQTVSETRWSKSITVTTDANGGIVAADKFDVPMTITTTGAKATWSGTPSKFTSVTFALNNTTVYSGEVANGTTYKVSKQVKSGTCNYSINAAGGPKNTQVTVTIYFNLGR